MFGIGAPELIFILVLALLIFGPKRLPQLGRTLGKGMAEFRKASTEIQRAFNTELDPPAETPAQRYAKRAMALGTPHGAEAVSAAGADAPAPPAPTAAGEAPAPTPVPGGDGSGGSAP